MATKVIIGTAQGAPVRFSYVNVFTPKLNEKSHKVEYSITLLIPKSNAADLEKVRKAIKFEQDATFTSKGKKVPPKAWNPLRDGDNDTKENGDPYGPETRGHFFLGAKAGIDFGAPGVVDAKLQKIIDPKELVAGDWGAASINFKGYETGTGGVGVYINNVQKLKTGQPLGGTSRAEDDFTAVEEDFLA